MHTPLRASALRYIRVAAIAYLLLIIVGTHWPRLDLSMGMPASDKLMHFIAFGLAVIAFWMACWFTRVWSLFLAGSAFVVLDEISQGLFAYGRHFSVADVIAGLLGVIVAVAVVYACAPVGGPLARRTRERWVDTAASLLARPGPWTILLCSGALGVLVGGVGLMLVDSIFPVPNPVGSFQIGAFIGSVSLVAWSLEMGLRHESPKIDSGGYCRSCGYQTGAAGVSGELESCPECGRRFTRNEWITVPFCGRDALLKALFVPILRSLVVWVVIYCVLVVFFTLEWARFSSFQLFTVLRDMGFESQRVIDLMIFGLLAAWTIRSIRKRVANRVDRQWAQCVACGHSLQGIPCQSGRGQCPECGVLFQEPESVVSSA